MSVKNISKYHELKSEDLNKLGTRELVAALESTRAKIKPEEGTELDETQEVWNKQQDQLQAKLKDILKDREDVSTKEVPKKVEKKKMKY